MLFNIEKKGFTLAEILITLAIIGVVAALTLPVLVKKYQKHQMIVQLKKAYSTINQTLALSVVKNGQISEWDFTAANYQNFTNQYILPFIKTTKVCGTGDGCVSKTYSFPKTSTLSTKQMTLAGNITSFITADGMGVALIHEDDNGVEIHVDLDGPEKGAGPYKSTMGRDRFAFYIYPAMKGTTLSYVVTGTYNPSTGVYTYNRQTNLNTCKSMGISCVAVILAYDKWQIKDDYPW